MFEVKNVDLKFFIIIRIKMTNIPLTLTKMILTPATKITIS